MKKTFVKPQAQLTSMESQQMICASNGLTGGNGTNIGNGGTTSGGASAGFTGVDAKGGSMSFDL